MIRLKKPLFIVGGFGGCAGTISKHILGANPDELTESFQTIDKKVSAVFDAHIAAGKLVSYPSMLSELRNCGIKGLRNGLSPLENRLLFRTTDIPEIVRLIIKGLSNV